MDDRNQEVFRKYDIKVYTTYKARGAVVLESDRGLMLLKNFEGSGVRVEFENALKEYLMSQGYTNVDLYLRNMDGELITEDFCGNRYVLKNWFVGEECNLKETQDIIDAAANLAILHRLMNNVPFEKEMLDRNQQNDLFDTFEKRNRELKRVRTYIKDKRQKNEFELCYISNYDRFYEQGMQAIEQLKASDYRNLFETAISQKTVCHGNYTYHNVMMLRGNQPASTYESREERQGVVDSEMLLLSAADLGNDMNLAATTNFDKASVGLQIVDLYHFLRKVMEKSNWEIQYGDRILENYTKVRPISNSELKILYILLLYPEKFWKITNYYYNGKKSWVPQRNIQKLLSLQNQYATKQAFLENFRMQLS